MSRADLSDVIIAAARECIGTKFRHQGRIVGVGLDCAGLIVHVVNRLGLSYQDVPGYSRLPHHGRLQAALDDQPCLQRVRTMQPGDVLLMRFKTEPTHLGIYAGETMIHAWEQVGKVAEHNFDWTWSPRVVAVYRIVGDA